jgi:hypothetical protein
MEMAKGGGEGGGEGGEERETASAWFKQGADLGHGLSQFMLARQMLTSVGKGTDVSAAWQLLSKASKQQVEGAAELLQRLELATQTQSKKKPEKEGVGREGAAGGERWWARLWVYLWGAAGGEEPGEEDL